MISSACTQPRATTQPKERIAILTPPTFFGEGLGINK